MIEKELYESEEVFKELFDNMSRGVGVYETLDDGKSFIIQEMNKSGLKICQGAREEIVGNNVAKLFPNVEDFGFVDLLSRVWKTGKPEHSPTAFYQDERVDGWTELYAYKLSSGKVVVIFEKQSELIEAEEKYKKKVEFEKSVSAISSRFVNPLNIDDAINSTLKEIGILTKASRSYLFLFNEDKTTMCNTHEWTIEGVSPQLQEPELQNVPMEMFSWSLSRLKNGEILNIQDIMDLPLEASAEKEEFQRENIKSLIMMPLKIGDDYSGFIGLDNTRAPETWKEDDLNLLKITSEIIGNALKRRKTEQELEGLNIDLRSIVEERTRKLQESEEKYRKAYNHANLYRDIFAHDINNILQNVQSSAELSSIYLNNPDKLSTLKELYYIIIEQVERGRKLIENVRKITKIDQSEIILEKVEGYNVLEKAIDYIKNSFQTRNIDVNVNSPEKILNVRANNLLVDVFENILINAVRHNNKSNIDIEIDISKYKAENNDYYKIEFKDNGIGISDYRKKSIFEKGTRKSQKTKGMGL
ncbi:MAG: ATP-binding protein, partial [Promethearchaeota archaeon]